MPESWIDSSDSAQTRRAFGLLAAIGYCWHAQVHFSTVMDLADQFSAYIQAGTWPREAVRTHGQSGEDSQGPDASLGEQAGKAGDGEPLVQAVADELYRSYIPGGMDAMEWEHMARAALAVIGHRS